MTDYHWVKKGLIYAPTGDGFFKTHVTRSIPRLMNDRVLRLYFSSRDSDDRPLPTFIDVDIENPSQVIHVNDKPLMGLGRIGTFDDSGVTPTCILEHDEETWLYYVGWKRRRVNVTIEPSIGLCRLGASGESLERYSEGPILAQDRQHPILVAAPFVLREESKYRMWYCSGTEWRVCNGNPEMIYNVWYAESQNGVDWIPHAKPVIDYQYDGEVISAPWVVKKHSRYLMWYSIRGSSTKMAKRFVIGYAESDDGINWVRMDDRVGIGRSRTGWDSEMICYPAILAFQDRIYMFYSGNDVGKGGVGYAIMHNFLR